MLILNLVKKMEKIAQKEDMTKSILWSWVKLEKTANFFHHFYIDKNF